MHKHNILLTLVLFLILYTWLLYGNEALTVDIIIAFYSTLEKDNLHKLDIKIIDIKL